MARQPNSERWLPGEYAECTHQGPWFLRGVQPNGGGPREGEVLKVQKVVLTSARLSSRPTYMLAFERWPKRLFPLSSFRKATRPSIGSRIADRLRPAPPRLADVGAMPIASAIYSAAAVVVSQLMEGGR